MKFIVKTKDGQKIRVEARSKQEAAIRYLDFLEDWFDKLDDLTMIDVISEEDND